MWAVPAENRIVLRVQTGHVQSVFLPVIPIAMPSVTSPKIKKIIDLVLANSGPTLDTFLCEKLLGKV